MLQGISYEITWKPLVMLTRCPGNKCGIDQLIQDNMLPQLQRSLCFGITTKKRTFSPDHFLMFSVSSSAAYIVYSSLVLRLL